MDPGLDEPVDSGGVQSGREALEWSSGEGGLENLAEPRAQGRVQKEKGRAGRPGGGVWTEM